MVSWALTSLYRIGEVFFVAWGLFCGSGLFCLPVTYWLEVRSVVKTQAQRVGGKMKEGRMMGIRRNEELFTMSNREST